MSCEEEAGCLLLLRILLLLALIGVVRSILVFSYSIAGDTSQLAMPRSGMKPC